MATRGRKRGIEVRTPPGPKPDPPSWLTSDARELWNEYADTLNALGILERLDAITFGILCDSIAALEDMRSEFRNDGSYTNNVGENGAIQANPLVQLIAQQAKAVITLASEFGMTPRGRINLTGSLSCDPDAGQLNPMEALLAEVRGFDPSRPQETARPAEQTPEPASTPAAQRKKPAKKKKSKPRKPKT
jgi:P27 family predicted phage terminase small subunit